MDPKAEHIIKNTGAIAETVSVFYNSIAKQVPRDVALLLTKHFMDLTINPHPVRGVVVNGNLASAIAAAQAAGSQPPKSQTPQPPATSPQPPENPETSEPKEEP